MMIKESWTKAQFNIGKDKVDIYICRNYNGTDSSYITAVKDGYFTYEDIIGLKPIVYYIDKALFASLYEKKRYSKATAPFLKEAKPSFSWYPSYEELITDLQKHAVDPYSVYSKEFNLYFLRMIPLTYFDKKEAVRFKKYRHSVMRFYNDIHEVSFAEQCAMADFSYSPKYIGKYAYVSDPKFVKRIIDAFENRIGHPVLMGYLFNGRNNKEDTYFIYYLSKILHLLTFEEFEKFLVSYYESINVNLKEWYAVVSNQIENSAPYAVKYRDPIVGVEYYRVPLYFKRDGNNYRVMDIAISKDDETLSFSLASSILKEMTVSPQDVLINSSYAYREAL